MTEHERDFSAANADPKARPRESHRPVKFLLIKSCVEGLLPTCMHQGAPLQTDCI
jgi:hypothetical protein